MPDVPRDPRQLARDILSGKVRIEDLARERQLRGGGGMAPQRVPLPRPVQPAQRPPAPAQRAPVRQPPRPAPPPLQRQQRPIAFPQQRQPQYTVRAPAPAAPPPPPPRQPEAPAPEALPGAKVPKRSFRLNELVRSKHALRQGILLSEVLGRPVSLRDE